MKNVLKELTVSKGESDMYERNWWQVSENTKIYKNVASDRQIKME
jgi:hypothetical protein